MMSLLLVSASDECIPAHVLPTESQSDAIWGNTHMLHHRKISRGHEANVIDKKELSLIFSLNVLHAWKQNEGPAMAEMLIAQLSPPQPHLTLAVANCALPPLYGLGKKQQNVSLCFKTGIFQSETQLWSKISPSSPSLSISCIQPAILLRAMCILLPAGGVFSRFDFFFFSSPWIQALRVLQRRDVVMDAAVPRLFPWPRSSPISNRGISQ